MNEMGLSRADKDFPLISWSVEERSVLNLFSVRYLHMLTFAEEHAEVVSSSN